ncbi:hypothetical protein EV649_1314 [Kribbella sp. VKM Ac-2569]|nr:hypothetical protein EV649_1314 [Kribbella sp. VKM Ac-2569]
MSLYLTALAGLMIVSSLVARPVLREEASRADDASDVAQAAT